MKPKLRLAGHVMHMAVFSAPDSAGYASVFQRSERRAKFQCDGKEYRLHPDYELHITIGVDREA